MCNSYAHHADACEENSERLNGFEQRFAHLDSQDPEVITLHYYFLQDCINELRKLKDNGDDILFYCQNKNTLKAKGMRLLTQADSLQSVLPESQN